MRGGWRCCTWQVLKAAFYLAGCWFSDSGSGSQIPRSSTRPPKARRPSQRFFFSKPYSRIPRGLHPSVAAPSRRASSRLRGSPKQNNLARPGLFKGFSMFEPSLGKGSLVQCALCYAVSVSEVEQTNRERERERERERGRESQRERQTDTFTHTQAQCSTTGSLQIPRSPQQSQPRPTNAQVTKLETRRPKFWTVMKYSV